MPPPDADWFADDAFWATAYPLMFPPERFAVADAELDAVLALVGGRPRRVIDLACGPGRHAVAAAARGLDVVGIDRSAFLLEKARALAAREGQAVRWVLADMREPVDAPPADLVLSLFTSFGYFAAEADNLRVLQAAHAALRPGGTLVVDVLGKEVLARIFLPRSVEETPAGPVVQRRRVVDGWARIENEWTFPGEPARTFRPSHWLYSGAELRRMLGEAGFADVALFGDFAGAPYGPEAERLVAVARRA